MRLLLQGPPDTQVRTKWLSLEGKPIEVSLSRNASKKRDALKSVAHCRFKHKDCPGSVPILD